MADLTRMVSSASGDEALRQQYFQASQQLLNVASKELASDAVVQAEAGAEQEKESALSEKEQQELRDAIEQLDEVIKPLSIGLNVQRIESINRLYVQLLDRETGEVLREIPPRKILKMQENLRAMQGLLFDKFS